MSLIIRLGPVFSFLCRLPVKSLARRNLRDSREFLRMDYAKQMRDGAIALTAATAALFAVLAAYQIVPNDAVAQSQARTLVESAFSDNTSPESFRAVRVIVDSPYNR